MTNFTDYSSWVGNPFDVDILARRLSASRLLNKIDVTRVFHDLIKVDKIEDAETFLLAVSHWQVCNNAEMTLFEGKDIKGGRF